MPPDASRCPSCGHVVGDVLVVEVGRSEMSPRARSRRRRDLLALGAVAAVVIGVLALVGGGGGGEAGEQAGEEPTTSTTERRSSSERRSRATTTTTTVPRGPMLGSPVGLTLAIAGPRGVVLTDLDTGTQVAEIPGTETVVSTGNGLAFSRQGQAFYLAAPFAGVPLLLGGADQVLASDQPDRVWLLEDADDGTPPTLVREVGVDGTEVVEEQSVPGWPMGPVAGGLLVERYGGWHLFERDGGSRLLFHGQMVGAGIDRVAYLACDDLTDCHVRVVHIESGDERRFDLPSDFDMWGSYGYPFRSATSEQGNRVVVTIQRTGELQSTSVGVFDLETGALTPAPLSGNNGISGTAWAPDGERLFLVNGSTSVWSWRVGEPTATRMKLSWSSVDQWGIEVFASVPAAG